MNTYRFEFTQLSTGTLAGCYVDAPTPREAWALFEATHPPRRYVVTAFRLFWDGATNRPPATRALHPLHD